ncbi:MAG: YIP1 family protein [Clostridia bacterium]|nr:YIP1 family protein [Clostridia bacterium]
MKRITSVLLVLLSLVMIASAMTVGAGASSAYQTYTYDINGKALYSPDAYSADLVLDSAALGLTTPLNTPNDLFTDAEGNVYIADSGNNRIVCLDRYYQYRFSISQFDNEQGNPDSLAAPEGVFVNEEYIWVCDTEKNRIVRFTREGEFDCILPEPESQLFDEDDIYKPIAMAVDQHDRIYVVSSTTHQGIIMMDSNGAFIGFIGAQAVTLSAWDILWRRFATEEQEKYQAENLASEFNNICLSTDGFVYVTISTIDENQVASAIKGKAKAGTYMPVKLLNPAGDEIMRRNGFWPPAGEVDFSTAVKAVYKGVSTVTDVAQGPEKTWTIIDSKRNKIYTYDFNGNLLFAFGDKGDMLGSISSIEAVCYQGDTMLVLDKSTGIVVYKRTEYGDLLLEAIAAENSLDYDYAIACWEEVLQRNANFDAAYIGIGNALYRSGDYSEALEYFETAYETTSWSESYKQVRKEWMSDWFILMMLIIAAVIAGVVVFFSWAAKVNKRGATDGKARKSFGQEVIYGFHVIFHPFDGFYDLKHEKRGSIRASIVFIAATVLAFFYQSIGQGYSLNPTGASSTIVTQALSVLIPLALFVIGNWCLTTLFEGEGSFKDIFIATSYSLVPLPLLIVPATLCSNWVTDSEKSLITFVGTVAFVWVFLLLYFGVMVTHDYSLGKNLITIAGTLVAMACIIFIVLLFSVLLSKLVSLGTNLVTEIQYRL